MRKSGDEPLAMIALRRHTPIANIVKSTPFASNKLLLYVVIAMKQEKAKRFSSAEIASGGTWPAVRAGTGGMTHISVQPLCAILTDVQEPPITVVAHTRAV
jgi:hypothetical protein